MFGMLSDRQTIGRSKWFFCAMALTMLAAPVPPPSSATGAVTAESPRSGAALVPPKGSQPAMTAVRDVPPQTNTAPAGQVPATLKPKLASAFTVNGILELDSPIDYGDYAWNEEGVPEGPTTIVVDIRAQRLYAYRGGIEIGRSSILYGADDKPTPLGVFPILQKKRHHISNLYGAPMPYMMRLTMDGVAIHASDVEEGYATHGCVGVPMEFAALLFAEAKMGDKVLVTDAWKPEIYWKQSAWADDETA